MMMVRLAGFGRVSLFHSFQGFVLKSWWYASTWEADYVRRKDQIELKPVRGRGRGRGRGGTGRGRGRSVGGSKGRGRGGKKNTNAEEEIQEDENENQDSANDKASTKRVKHENLKNMIDDSNWYYAGDWWDETLFNGHLDEETMWWEEKEKSEQTKGCAKKEKHPKRTTAKKVKSPKTRQAKATPKTKVEATRKAKHAKQPAGQSTNSPVKQKSKKQNKQNGSNQTKKRKQSQSPTKKAKPATASKGHKKQKKEMMVGKSIPEEVILYTKRINKFLKDFVGFPDRKCDAEQKQLSRSQLWDLKGTDLSYNIYWSKTGSGLKCKSEGRDFAYRAVDNPKSGTWLLRMATVMKAAEQMVAFMQYVQHKLAQQLQNYYVVLFCCLQCS